MPLGSISTLFIVTDQSLCYSHSLLPLAPSLVFYAILTPGIILDHVTGHTDASSNVPAWHFLDLQQYDLHFCSSSVASSYGHTLCLVTNLNCFTSVFQTLKFCFLTNTSSLSHSLSPYSHRTSLTSLTPLIPSLFLLTSVLSWFYGLSHSINHFTPALNPDSHLILIPTSILNSLISLLFPCTCPANLQT